MLGDEHDLGKPDYYDLVGVLWVFCRNSPKPLQGRFGYVASTGRV